MLRKNKKPKNYFILKAGPSFLFTKTKKGAEQISFPYSVKPVNGGASTDSLFASNSFSPLKKMQTAIYFTIEAGSRNHFFEVNFGGYTSADAGAFIAVAYGRNFYLNIFGKHTQDPMQRNFVLKPSLHIGYNSFNKSIGKLDNLSKYIYVGGYTSGPTFTESNIGSDGFTSTKNTYSTNTLAIAYLQRSFLISPQIALGNNQYKHIFHWEIITGTYYSITEAIKAKFTQQATNVSHSASCVYSIGTNGINASFNGNNITKAAFRFAGFKIGFNVGISKGNIPKHKVKDSKNL